jgi:hypothetical protein
VLERTGAAVVGAVERRTSAAAKPMPIAHFVAALSMTVSSVGLTVGR